MINNYLIKIIEDLEEVRELDILESAHNENEFDEELFEQFNEGKKDEEEPSGKKRWNGSDVRC